MLIKNDKERESWLDITKGLGIFLMVIGHTKIPDTIKIWIYSFHMPLFFIVTGYLFNKEKWKAKGLGVLLKTRAQAYLIPYFVLFFINFFIYFGLQELIGEGHSAVDYIIAGIYSHDTNMPNCAPLWFLTCLFVSHLFFWILINRNLYWQIIVSILYIFFLMIICSIEKSMHISQLPWHIDVALIASVFMTVGYHLKGIRCYSVLKKNTYLLFSFLVGSMVGLYNGKINMVQNQYQNIILFIISAVLISASLMFGLKKLFAYDNSNFIGNILAFWGRNTYFFIGFNYVVNTFIRKVCEIMSIPDNVYNLLDIILVMTSCSILAIMVNKLKQKK